MVVAVVMVVVMMGVVIMGVGHGGGPNRSRHRGERFAHRQRDQFALHPQHP